MAIVIDSLQINTEATEIQVAYSTTGNPLTSLYVYSKYDDSDILDLTNLIDIGGVFTITVADLGVDFISGIYYFEFNSIDDKAVGLVANFVKYHECLLAKTLTIDVKGCDEIIYDGCPECEGNFMLSSIVLDNLYNAIVLGYYTEADTMLVNLTEMCVLCTTCPDYLSYPVVPGYGFSTTDNNIIRG